MDYQNIYHLLVSKRQQFLAEGYTERHHIIPRCMGGTNEPNNLVRLTAREHFIAHLLLAKIYGGKLIHTAFMMSNYKKCNSKSYKWLKEKHAYLTSERMKNRIVSEETRQKNSRNKKGTTHSEETKQKMKESHSKRKYKLNKTHKQYWIDLGYTEEEALDILKKNYPTKFENLLSKENRMKANESKRGKKASEETRKKMSLSQQGRKHTEESKEKMRESAKNREPISEDLRKKLSESAKNRPKRICSEETKKKISLAKKKKYSRCG